MGEMWGNFTAAYHDFTDEHGIVWEFVHDKAKIKKAVGELGLGFELMSKAVEIVTWSSLLRFLLLSQQSSVSLPRSKWWRKPSRFLSRVYRSRRKLVRPVWITLKVTGSDSVTTSPNYWRCCCNVCLCLCVVVVVCSRRGERGGEL